MENYYWKNERRVIKCCKDCKPPKRKPGCGDHCPEYKAEKAQLKADKEREKEIRRSRPLIKDYDFNRF